MYDFLCLVEHCIFLTIPALGKTSIGDANGEIARLKLDAMGVKIKTLTEERGKYFGSWEEGT